MQDPQVLWVYLRELVLINCRNNCVFNIRLSAWTLWESNARNRPVTSISKLICIEMVTPQVDLYRLIQNTPPKSPEIISHTPSNHSEQKGKIQTMKRFTSSCDYPDLFYPASERKHRKQSWKTYLKYLCQYMYHFLKNKYFFKCISSRRRSSEWSSVLPFHEIPPLKTKKAL